jgi:DsbC/DsbD-like thiol-disulfide interchange protein
MLRILQRIAIVGLFLWSTVPGRAQPDASRWDGGLRSGVRLIAGADGTREGFLRAGIEIRLGNGWKTYWRYPGDSGVPPDISFAGSANVERVEVRWPAPKTLAEADSRSIGYTDDVILPLRVVPQDRGKPVVLSLHVHYAICDKLCVPAEGEAELSLPAGASTHEPALRSSEARVPAVVGLGARPGLAVTTVRREPGPVHPRVVVDVAAPGAAKVELFAEGPTSDWALPVPSPIPTGGPGLHRFAFDLDGMPAGAEPHGVVIKLTAVSPDHAIEVDAPLD